MNLSWKVVSWNGSFQFILYGELPTNEIKIAIKGFMTKNCPGTDEFTAEFYRTFKGPETILKLVRNTDIAEYSQILITTITQNHRKFS